MMVHGWSTELLTIRARSVTDVRRVEGRAFEPGSQGSLTNMLVTGWSRASSYPVGRGGRALVNRL